ncbi:hypothetical protein KGF54_001693 [Candida jiufengensis]|uniref:uncharacterized protein n=1 Tax=Candida jiufengensis TaxID=497108 RepID=UPI0022248761|nr:uncharacterized protein KGF54_001693 [Candida jiufengensis]KAI5955132.1 hypothetical protein KGF54_001693 [Candida jiufengensis]
MTTVASNVTTNPISSIDHEAIALFEKAIEKESQGLMSDAVENYRKAFKLNEKIDSLYRSVKVPTNIKKIVDERGKNVMTRVDDKIVARINVDKLIASFADIEVQAGGLDLAFSNLSIDHAQPPSPLTHLPTDIWLYILEILVLTNPESWFMMSITCKKFAYLGFNTSVWRTLCNTIYPAQIYEENLIYLASQTSSQTIELPIPKNQLEILPQYDNSWKKMLHERPFIKFHGCYISIVNYYSEGGKSEFSLSWTNPVKTITYYRYIRFYPDGTMIKVLSVLPPNQVVSWLSKERKSIPHEDTHDKESHKIYSGKWKINSAGEVHVQIDNGSTSYLTFHYYFQVKNLGHFKHGKMNWIKYFAVRKSTGDDDDRVGEIMEYSIRNEKPFKFSKVRSYKI